MRRTTSLLIVLLCAAADARPFVTQQLSASIPPAAALAWDTSVCASPTTCPTASQASGAGTSITTGSFATQAGSVLVSALCVNCVSTTPTINAPTYGSLSWTQQVTGAGTLGTRCSVYFARAASAVSSQTLAHSWTVADNCSAKVWVYGIAGANATQNGTTCSFANDGTGAAVQCTTTTPPASTSWFVGSVMSGNPDTLAAAANNTFDSSGNVDANNFTAECRYTGTLGSNITFGSSTTSAFSVAVGAEVKL